MHLDSVEASICWSVIVDDALANVDQLVFLDGALWVLVLVVLIVITVLKLVLCI